MNKRYMSAVLVFLVGALVVPLAVQPPVPLSPGDEVSVSCAPGSTISGPRTNRRIVCPTLTPASFSRQIFPGSSAGWEFEKSGALETITALNDGWQVTAGGYPAQTHYARIRYKLPETAGIVLTDFYMQAVIVLPHDFYAQQTSGFRIMNTDNFTATLNGVPVGANNANESRASLYIGANHLLQFRIDHQGRSSRVLYTSALPLPVGEHTLELSGSLDKAAPWFLRVDGQIAASGTAMLSNTTTHPSERVATRMGVGIDGASGQDAQPMTLKIKSFLISSVSITPANTPTNTPASTPIVSQTPSKTNTPVPTFTPPSSGSVQPFASAPLCSTHDNTTWHALWDSARGCHYDHEHGDNPDSPAAVAVFGTAGAQWTGGNVNYPWKTIVSEQHSGFKWYVNMNPAPYCVMEGLDPANRNCISAFRILMHVSGSNAHNLKRFHSYFTEFQITDPPTGRRGLVQTGGHFDSGCIHVGYKTRFYPVAGDPQNPDGSSVCGTTQNFDMDPYRVLIPPETAFQNTNSVWSSHARYGFHQIGDFFFFPADPFSVFDTAAPLAETRINDLLTSDRYNNSQRHVFHTYVDMRGISDGDNDGFITLSGFLNPKQEFDPSCSVPSVTCVPFRFLSAPAGEAFWSRNQTAGVTPDDPQRDYDIYFDAQGNYVPTYYDPIPAGLRSAGWIVFPN